MLRKTLLALAATAVLGTLPLTSAFAHGIGYGHGPGHFIGHDFRRHLFGHGYWGGFGYSVVDNGCFYTPRGVLVCPEY